ncbi:MAG: DNA alkylation response protein [Alphaproteobacteria bacterium]|nr:MAG: DNA alkylation response protein [Alphaproteobacteria bacterium]
MEHLPPTERLSTHEVENQPEFPDDIDLWCDDPALSRHAAAAGADTARLAAFGLEAGRAAWREAARNANRCPPELHLFDRGGRRLDEVRFHPDYHRLMALGIGHGYAALPWTPEGAEGGHATHAGLVWMMTRLEPGVCCPMTMSYAAVPALGAADAETADLWRARLVSASYDPRVLPVADKSGATMGMAMTEKQGGSDVRRNTTRAERDGTAWRLTGHKWFCSAPMSDGFLTLAQTDGGLTCFLVPRWLPDGTRNAIRLLRLKDKLGDRANASAEIEYERAFALQLGDTGAGVRTIIRMVHHTRLDTAIAPAAIMSAALGEAVIWASGRYAFQRRLIDQPLMARVLAEIALEVEGAAALGFGVARAFDGSDEADRAMARIGVALAKYLNNRRCTAVVHEAMEVMGGMGYVEDTPMPLLFRQAPLNGIWEGAGNVICLDILRTLSREPAAMDALSDIFAETAGASARLDRAVAEFRATWPRLPAEIDARLFAERLASILAAAFLVRAGQAEIADAYVRTRLPADRGLSIGTATGVDPHPILKALVPAAAF